MSKETFSPYVGLRPFETSENLLFFGRDDQTLEILQRLHLNRFVAVVGGSGSGKSSLIRAGLIPALKGGYLVEDSSRWHIAVMKPGQNPMFKLAEAILIQDYGHIKDNEISDFVIQIKKEGVKAILNRIDSIRKNQNINFFLLVDQFEELFRFTMDQTEIEKKDEAIDFVNIMLELAQQNVIPIYVVLTMRSDFIGDCTQFYGLPEAMNKSQYLVPRLNRVQLKMVIEGPAKLYGKNINPALTSRLLNELGKVKDELPLLQHALMRIWHFEVNKDKNGELDLEDYKNIGGIEKALSIHADEALKVMSMEEVNYTKKIFQALTTIDEDGRKIRRPVRLTQLISLTGTTEEQVLKLIDLFNQDQRSFLVINKTGEIGDMIIDISHESLIRQWDTLSKWVDEEGESASKYKQLVEAIKQHKERNKEFLTGSQLQLALEWRNKYNPTAIWANRYKEGFEDCMEYLKLSEAELIRWEKKEMVKRRNKRYLVSSIIIILLFASIGGGILTKNARNSANYANKLQVEMEKTLLSEKKSNEIANQANSALVAERDNLKKAKDTIQINSDKAIAAAKYAKKQEEIAIKNADWAQEQTLKAEKSLEKADKLVQAFYFYDGKYAIASNSGKEFYFIDKEGNNIDVLGKWSRAEQFDDFGFARVKDRDYTDFLIDTIGNKYKASFSEFGIDNSTKAIELSYLLYGEMSDSIYNAKNLQILSSRCNYLNNISPKIGELKHLKILDLAENNLKSLPKEIGELTSLNRLSLRKNPFDSLPKEIWELDKLTILELDSTQLTILPKKVGNLKDLVKLTLGGNQLNNIPHEIGNLENLTTLSLSKNELAYLPVEIGNLNKLTSLDLSNNQLVALPKELNKLENLTMISLNSNKLESFPLEVIKMDSLKWLYLSFNLISNLTEEIGKLENLRELGLSGNLLTTLPKEIGKLKKLTGLGLGSNKLTNLPKEIWELTNLNILYLYANELENLPTEIGNLKKLTSLDLQNNKLSVLPIEFWELKNLSELSLSGNQFNSLPNEIGEMKNLTIFLLNNNQFKTLPKGIKELTNLNYLDLSKNQLKYLPVEIEELKNLRTLNLNYNFLTNLPKEIIKLENLEYFDLSNNQLTSLPNEIGGLKKISTLNLSSNLLTNLPDEIGGLNTLYSLNLSGNKLISLQGKIGILNGLSDLNLSNNQLKSLPSEIGKMTGLTSLDLSNNQLTSLPKEIGQLNSLYSLDLSNNLLNALPDEIGNLEYVTSLVLNNNRLKYLPNEIGKFTSLYSLDLSNNQLTSLPKEIGELIYLYSLNLSGNKFSKTEIYKLQKLLPDCEIIYE